jgi:hypothetical protein
VAREALRRASSRLILNNQTRKVGLSEKRKPATLSGEQRAKEQDDDENRPAPRGAQVQPLRKLRGCLTMPTNEPMRWADRLRIARKEITCACIVISDALERREAQKPDWDRLAMALRRLTLLAELS